MQDARNNPEKYPLSPEARAFTEKQQEIIDDVKGMGESPCCGAGTYGDYQICEDCGEHC